MSHADPVNLKLNLRLPLRWLIGLRWLAGATVLVGSLANALWLHWYPHSSLLLACGPAILLYNAALVWAMRHPALRRDRVVVFAWINILADLAVLSAITVFSGGLDSPVLGFFVFHMVFAGLLLSPRSAYVCAAAGVAMLIVGLAVGERLPAGREGALVLVGWAMTLLLTVYLTEQIAILLRRHRRQLAARNRRIRRLVDDLRHQQTAMIQHEKSVTMGHMAAGVAHEIANPLASMDSLLQLMNRNEKHITPDKIDTLRKQIERIKVTLRQMTDFAHVTDYAWQAIPINDLVRSAFEMVRFDHRLRGITLDEQFCERNCIVRVQPHAVQQVLVNLMLNAMDALQGRPNPRITVSTRCEGHGPSIFITDNGPGIDPKHRSDLFEPFFTTKPIGKGTGLGLTISSQLMRNQGGRLELVDTPPGQGATFHVTLPPHSQAPEA